MTWERAATRFAAFSLCLLTTLGFVYLIANIPDEWVGRWYGWIVLLGYAGTCIQVCRSVWRDRKDRW